MRHQNGVWNAIWSDMYIESTVMRYGHAPGGLKGIELNERCQARWALSHHVCSKMVQDLSSLEARSKNEVTIYSQRRKTPNGV